MNLKKNLKKPLELIYEQGGIFWPSLRRLHETEFSIKGRCSPFRNSSTTYGKRKIALARNFIYWPVDHQASNLLHESIHEAQYEDILIGLFFWTEYIRSKKFRFESELEAFLVNATWWAKLGVIRWDDVQGIPDFHGIRYVNSIILNYPKNYLAPWQREWFDKDPQKVMRKELNNAIRVTRQ